MSDGSDLFKELQERQAEAMKQFQDVMADTAKAWQNAFGLAGSSDAEGGGDATSTKVMADVANGYFKFASDMLERQHEFTLRLIEAMSPKR